MPVRRLPVRPDLEQLQRQAKELLRAIHAGDANAIAELREHHPESIDPAAAKLADAQLVLARSYGASSWTRLVHAVQLADAIWRDDLDSCARARHAQSGAHPRACADSHRQQLGSADDLRGEPRPRPTSSGCFTSCGATDLDRRPAGRRCRARPTRRARSTIWRGDRRSRSGARRPRVHAERRRDGRPVHAGARVVGPEGVDRNTVEHLLETDSRKPEAKHRILEMYVEHGFEPPDTPVMALHRGRIDLLEEHLARDPDLLTRTFDIDDIFPLAPACAREPSTAQGTPLHGTTLLHMCVLRRDGDRGVADRAGH